MDFPGGKVDGVSTLSAADYNQTVGLNNAIASTGQTPSSSDLNQLAKSMARYGAGNFYSDSGVANAYSLSVIGSVQTPAAYFDGMEIRFRAANQSTGSSTVTVGALGSKAIKQTNGVTDITTEISTTADSILRFDNANDCFIYDTGISAATTTVTGISLLSSPITLKNNIVDANNDIDFAAGVMQFDDGSGQAATTAITKQLDANFVAGTNQGGLDTGTKAADTTYHCFAIYNPATGATDALFSTSLTSPALPSGFTKKKHIASIVTNGSSNIYQGTFTFDEAGNYCFELLENLLDYSGSASTTATLHPLTVPTGIQVFANIEYYADPVGGIYYTGLITSPSKTDVAPTGNNFNVSVEFSGEARAMRGFKLLTDTSGQIRSRWSGSTDIDEKIFTSGWSTI